MIEIQQEWSEIELLFYEAYLDWARKDPEVKEKMKFQVRVGPYRVDFLYINEFVIELDGHDFHSGKEQRDRDYERERYLQNAGYEVIRFTGTQVMRNPRNCISDMMGIAYHPKRVWERHKAG